MKDFNCGDNVAWIMLDGQTMAGQVVFVGIDSYRVRRVDGTVCGVHKRIARKASPDDILTACDFFKNIVK